MTTPPRYAWFRGRRVMLPVNNPGYLDRLEAHALLRDAFVAEFKLRPIKWSAYNLSRMLRRTGERPERVAEIKVILCTLGMGDRRWIGCSGVFDHGEMWGRDGVPLIVGHPYGIGDDERALLAALARFPTLRVSVDDRPSYYGFGTNHVRIEVTEPRRPFLKPPSTYRTRAAAHAARKAFREEFGKQPLET